MSNKSQQQRFDSDIQQLKQLIPGLNSKNKNATQAEIMQEAAKYIDKLQTNLICHIRTHGYPEKLRTSNNMSNNHSSNSRSRNFNDSDSIKKTVESYLVKSNWSK